MRETKRYDLGRPVDSRQDTDPLEDSEAQLAPSGECACDRASLVASATQ